MRHPRKALLGVGILVITLAVIGVILNKNWKKKFEAPRQTAKPVTFMVRKESQLEGIVNNLEYYGFVKDKNAFAYALEHSKDNSSGRENAIKIGENTIDVDTDYEVSQTMSAWELADVLLNKGVFNNCSGGCPPGLFYPELLPGGNPAPSLREQYEWVKTFKDCVEAKGQLSSEQYTQRTGNPRSCVSPDGRQFIDGKEGWTEFRGG